MASTLRWVGVRLQWPVFLLLAVSFLSDGSSAQAGQRLRVATFNSSLFRTTYGALANEMNMTTAFGPRRAAEMIQYVNPDVILLNEFDYDPNGTSGPNFVTNYLKISQNGLSPIDFPYMYTAPSNTGIQPEDELGPGFDFDYNNAGGTDQADDAFGFGTFPGQYGMLILSKVPIDFGNVRTFQKFLWKDMPGALLPDDPATVGVPQDWYTPAEIASFRLSSKSHWDVPINVDGETIHLLTSHPTPPVFDGAEDRNGLRNHDEIRFWADYIDPNGSGYIYDDNEFVAAGNQTPASPSGGLAAGESFIIMGDQNADIDEGDSSMMAAQQLTSSPLINNSFVPGGGSGPQPDDTADFSGGVRVDYVLPSPDLTVEDTATKTGVFWPPVGHPQRSASLNSDHRPVFVDFVIGTIGDLDGNSLIDQADIDILYSSYADNNKRKFDLNESGTVGQNDVDYLVHTLLQTEYGDTDLDGDVDGVDFLNWQVGYGGDNGWAGGDIDGSGNVDGADLSIIMTNYGYVSPFFLAAAQAVPEPAALVMCGAALICVAVRRPRFRV